MNKLINIIIGLVFLINSLFAACLFTVIALPFWFINKKIYYLAVQFSQQMVHLSLLVTFNRMAPSTLCFYSSESVPILFDEEGRLNLDKKSVLIANHQLYNDWAYIWHLSYLANCSGYMKIISKKEVAKVPLVGWTMYLADFILLSRKWATDKFIFETKFSNYSKHLESIWLLIFPEGTTLCDKARMKSQAFAIENGQTVLKYCLTPRSLGLFTSVNGLRNTIDYVHDFTFAYEGIQKGDTPEEVYTLKKVYLEGGSPSKIHIHIKKYKVTDIPEDEEKFKQWLLNIWAEKDRLLDKFYSNGQFPSDKVEKTFDLSFNLIELIMFCLCPYILYAALFW